jgi:hypothetical protein
VDRRDEPSSGADDVERDDVERDDVERYEALRRRTLDGEPSGWRLGLAVLQRQGVAAWLRLGETLPPPSPTRTDDSEHVGGDALVGVLTTMALACLGGR